MGRSGLRPVAWLLVAVVGLSLDGATLLFGTGVETVAVTTALVVVAVLPLVLLDFR